MKAKIVAVRRSDSMHNIQIAMLPDPSGKEAFVGHCFAWCIKGVLSPKSLWHKCIKPGNNNWDTSFLTKNEKKAIKVLTTQAVDFGVFSFDDLKDSYHIRRIYMWERPKFNDSDSELESDTSRLIQEPVMPKSFSEIFLKNPEDGGYIICVRFNSKDIQSHAMALKFRKGQWQFMDPQPLEFENGRGYLHATLTAEGKLNIITEYKTLYSADLIQDYLFEAYDHPESGAGIDSIGVIRFRNKHSKS